MSIDWISRFKSFDEDEMFSIISLIIEFMSNFQAVSFDIMSSEKESSASEKVFSGCLLLRNIAAMVASLLVDSIFGRSEVDDDFGVSLISGDRAMLNIFLQ